MPRSKKPPLLVDSQLDDYEVVSNEPQPGPPQRKSIKPERLKKSQKARQFVVDGHLTAPEVFTQQYARKDIRSLPKELLLEIINAYLSDYDVVALAMTCRLLYEVSHWARQKHLKLIVGPCICCSVPQSPRQRLLNLANPAPCRDLVARTRLFRETLVNYFDLDYIYCGGIDKPPMRRVFPLKHSVKNEEHKNCCCIVSLVEREMDILKAQKRGMPRSKFMNYLKSIRVAQARINPQSRSQLRRRMQHPVFGDVRNWPWTSDVNWAAIKRSFGKADLSVAFLEA